MRQSCFDWAARRLINSHGFVGLALFLLIWSERKPRKWRAVK